MLITAGCLDRLREFKGNHHTLEIVLLGRCTHHHGPRISPPQRVYTIEKIYLGEEGLGDYVSKEGLTKLVQKCSKLTSIGFRHCNQLTDAYLFEMAEHCPNLVELWLYSNSPHITATGLFVLGTKCAKLKNVLVWKDVDFEKEKQALATQFPHVKWNIQWIDER